MKCTATTAKGTRCRNNVIAGTERCGTHTPECSPGRPSEYDPRFIAEALLTVDRGATWSAIAAACGKSEDTVEDWCNAESPRYEPEFSAAVTRARERCDDNAETGLYRRTVGYDYEETYTEERTFIPKPADLKHLGDAKDDYLDENGMLRERVTRTSTHHIPADVAAAKMWLPNRRPSRWQDKSVRELTGKDGAELSLIAVIGEVAETG